MTGERRLQASRDQARKLRQLLERTGNGIPHLPRLPASAGKAVVVQLLADIAADDYEQHAAALLALQAGTFVDTGQRLPVRCISDEIAFADSRVIVEPVGKLGLCFEYCSCRLPSLLVEPKRLVEPVGPQASARTTDTYDWTYNASYQTSNVQVPWTLVADMTGSPDEGSSPSDYAFVFEMKPMRYRIRANRGGINSTFGDYKAMERQQNDVASLGTLPPATSHLGPLNLTGCNLPVPIGYLAAASSNHTIDRGTYVTHYRLWIDGVDVTGIVALSPQLGFGGGTAYAPRSSLFSGFDVALAAALNSQAAVIEWDIWVKAKFYIKSSNLTPTALVCMDNTLNIFTTEVNSLATFAAADANFRRRSKDTYKLTFADHGPAGGLSEFTLEPQTGWVLNYETNVQQFYRHTSSGDAVYLSYGHEHPEIGIYIAAQAGSPTYEWSGWVRYFPDASGDYTTTSIGSFGSYANYQYGVWNPQGTTIFKPQGRYRQGTVNRYWIETKHAYASSYLGNFPSSISLSLV